MTDHSQDPAKPEQLEFSSDKGASRSFWVALVLTVNWLVGRLGDGGVNR